MKIAYLFAASALALTAASGEPRARRRRSRRPARRCARGIPAQLDPDQRDGYRAVFKAIREQRWVDAQIQLTR